MAGLGMHPRLAHMVLRGRERRRGALACELAALLEERDILRGERDADLRRRVQLLRQGAPGPAREVARLARDWQRRLKLPPGDGSAADTGPLLALAYPDRIAQRRPGPEPRYRLSNGGGAVFAGAEPLAAEDWLAVADLDGDRREARIFLAAPLTLPEIEDLFADRIRTQDLIAWDGREQAVLARRRRRLGELVLKDEPLPDPPPDAVAAALAAGIRELGLGVLPWTPDLESVRARIGFLRRIEGPESGWPDVADPALLATLEEWLVPYLGGITRAIQLRRVDLGAALRGLLDRRQSQELETLAPGHITVPSGSRLPIDYGGEVPVLAVRLQEMFGATETPAILRGRVPLLLHLLSPAHRPVQVTRDLRGFWADSYRAVKADLRGRYPRHPWPDDPLAAPPTSRAKRRGSQS
jgi:ATP-dependent helicase HrpB